jgi:2-keto-myo-inositol isomerase
MSFSFNTLEFITFRDKTGYNEIKKDLVLLGEVREKINCKKTVVVPNLDVGDYTKAEIMQEFILRLNELADIAEKYGVKLAYEFVDYPSGSINTLR